MLFSTVLFILPLFIILDICYHSFTLVFVKVLAFNSLYLCTAIFISIFIFFASWSLTTCLPLWCAFYLWAIRHLIFGVMHSLSFFATTIFMGRKKFLIIIHIISKQYAIFMLTSLIFKRKLQMINHWKMYNIYKVYLVLKWFFLKWTNISSKSKFS